MNAKVRRYLLLLLFSIIVRIVVYSFKLEGLVLDWIFKTDLIYNVIFFIILIILLNALQERKWLIGLAWVVFIDCILVGPLRVLQDQFSPFPQRQFDVYGGILGIPPTILNLLLALAVLRTPQLRKTEYADFLQ